MVSYNGYPLLDHLKHHESLTVPRAPPCSSSMVDLGCGDAALAVELKHRGYGKASGGRTGRMRGEVQNLGSLPADWTDRFDVAVLCRALWSLDYAQVLQETRRVLRKDSDARLVVVEPFRRWLKPAMVHDTVIQHGALIEGIEVMHSPMVTDAATFSELDGCELCKSGKQFADFTGDRNAENLIKFAAQHGARERVERLAPLEETRHEQLALVDPAAPVKAAEDHWYCCWDLLGLCVGCWKVVEYVAKSCPHCQSMEPIWNDLKAATASKKNILWEQKECFGKGWGPGKDLEECKKADIQGQEKKLSCHT
eukprot:Skav205749  [mRNA]  locus=scaffold2771:56673:66183:- [translate_table: standard]